ncbi:phosphoribosylformylglycinamidine synthase I [Patescibacteria group bacterium]
MKPKVLVLTGYGINSEEETAECFNITGSEAEIVHINDVVDGHRKLEDYQIMVFPGGFSYADDTGGGNALANKIKNNLQDDIKKFAQADKLIIGICNGFQILTKLGLVPATEDQYDEPEATLMHNKTVRLECRQVDMKKISKKCIWTKGIDTIRMPIAHGEGNFYVDDEILTAMKANDQIVFKYIKPDGSPANGELPFNPNGALEDIAGICDKSGRIFGLMPHPERINSFTNRDDWQLQKEKLLRKGKELPEEGEGLVVFKNASEYFG